MRLPATGWSRIGTEYRAQTPTPAQSSSTKHSHKINAVNVESGLMHKYPIDTLLERLVTADSGTEMIEHDPVRLHKMERLTSTTAADGTSSAYRDTAPHQAVGGTTMLVGPVHHEEVLARSSQRKLARSNIHTSMTGCAITGHSLNAPLRRLFGMLRHRVNASNAGQAPCANVNQLTRPTSKTTHRCGPVLARG